MAEEIKKNVDPAENSKDVEQAKENGRDIIPEAPDNAADLSSADEKKPTERRTQRPAVEGVEKVIKISRVSKVVKGGKNFSFNAMVVAGDGKGSVGFGFGKSNEVVGAITKGTQEAKRSFKKINLKDDTIPHEIIGRFKASQVLLKPASPGTGVIAGGPVRALCDAAGIKNILTKSLGSRNAINVVKAAMDGFLKLRLKRRG